MKYSNAIACFLSTCFEANVHNNEQRGSQLLPLIIYIVFNSLKYKYPSTLHRISYDVINILAILSHEISLKKKKNSLATWRHKSVEHASRRSRCESPSCSK